MFGQNIHKMLYFNFLKGIKWTIFKMPLKFHVRLWPGSLTHWKKWYPSLFSSLKMTPFFVAKHWLFRSKWPLFHDKTLTFQSKMNPLFCGKTLDFSAQMKPPFHGKTMDIKITLFSPNSWRWVPKYTLFLGKCESWISSKNTPLVTNFRTRLRVVK